MRAAVRGQSKRIRTLLIGNGSFFGVGLGWPKGLAVISVETSLASELVTTSSELVTTLRAPKMLSAALKDA